MSRTAKGEETKQRIQSAAIRLFRKQGFDQTTMRDIARAAKTSLGSAYYYFPQKEALVLAYFEEQMAEHEARCRALFEETRDLRQRVLITFRVRLELMQRDQKFFGSLFRSVGDPKSPVSVFSDENRPLRARGIGLLVEAVSVDEVPPEVRGELALGLWALMLGAVLYFVHDTSKGQEKTLQLMEGLIDLVLPLVPLLSLPEAQVLRARVFSVLTDAGLVPPAAVASR